jgi:hypothetical protein
MSSVADVTYVSNCCHVTLVMRFVSKKMVSQADDSTITAVRFTGPEPKTGIEDQDTKKRSIYNRYAKGMVPRKCKISSDDTTIEATQLCVSRNQKPIEDQ